MIGIQQSSDLQLHPKLGASWEGFALEQVITLQQARPEECYFWATHAHAELDLLIVKQGKQYDFEFKYTSAPKATKSMHIAKEALGLEKLVVIYPGEIRYPLAEGIEAMPLAEI